jgi:hypothetical protein
MIESWYALTRMHYRYRSAFSVPAVLHEEGRPLGTLVDGQVEVQKGPFEFGFGRQLGHYFGLDEEQLKDV